MDHCQLWRQALGSCTARILASTLFLVHMQSSFLTVCIQKKHVAPTTCLEPGLQDHERFLSPKEMLMSHGLPCTQKQARNSSKFELDLDRIPNTAMVKMAGNAMNVPCIGSVLLCCALSFERISKRNWTKNAWLHWRTYWKKFKSSWQPVAATIELISN